MSRKAPEMCEEKGGQGSRRGGIVDTTAGDITPQRKDKWKRGLKGGESTFYLFGLGGGTKRDAEVDMHFTGFVKL